jgi:hypothetical protein
MLLPHSPKDRKIEATCFFTVLLVLTILTSGCLLFTSAQLLKHKGDTTRPESCVLQNALWSLADHHFYHAVDSPPFTPAPYGPFFYWQLAKLAEITGGDFQSNLQAGRVFVFSCFLLLPVFCVLVLKSLAVDLVSSLIAAMLLISNIDFLYWNASARPDVPALLFEVAALFFVFCVEAEGVGAFAAGLCIAAAVLTKSSTVAGASAILVFYLFARKWKSVVIFVSAAALPVICAYAVLQLRGDPALHHLALLRHVSKDPLGAVRLLLSARNSPSKRVILALGLASLFPAVVSDGKRRLLGLYLLASWGLAAATLIQVGGNVNYLFSAWTATAFLSAVSLSELRLRWREIQPTARLVLLIVLVLEVGSGTWSAVNMLRSGDSDRTQLHLATCFRGQRILSDVSYLAVQGQDPMFLDPFLAHNLEENGSWSPAPIISRLDEKYWNVVMQWTGPDGKPAKYRRFTFFSPSIQAAIERNYQPVASCAGILVLLPKQSSFPLEPSHDLRSLPECDFRPTSLSTTAMVADWPLR